MTTRKPWEQDLEVGLATGAVWVRGSLAGLRHEMPDGHGCTPQEVVEFGRMFAAAPDMARALLGLGSRRLITAMEEWHLYGCSRSGDERLCDMGCEQARAALAKAGVL